MTARSDGTQPSVTRSDHDWVRQIIEPALLMLVPFAAQIDMAPGMRRLHKDVLTAIRQARREGADMVMFR